MAGPVASQGRGTYTSIESESWALDPARAASGKPRTFGGGRCQCATSVRARMLVSCADRQGALSGCAGGWMAVGRTHERALVPAAQRLEPHLFFLLLICLTHVPSCQSSKSGLTCICPGPAQQCLLGGRRPRQSHRSSDAGARSHDARGEQRQSGLVSRAPSSPPRRRRDGLKSVHMATQRALHTRPPRDELQPRSGSPLGACPETGKAAGGIPHEAVAARRCPPQAWLPLRRRDRRGPRRRDTGETRRRAPQDHDDAGIRPSAARSLQFAATQPRIGCWLALARRAALCRGPHISTTGVTSAVSRARGDGG